MPGPVVCGHARVHHNGKEDVDHLARLGTCEFPVYHSHDFVDAIAHTKRFSYDSRILAKAMLPVGLREHGVRMRTGLEIVIFRKQTSELWAQSEGREHPAADVLNLRSFHLLVGVISQ